MRRLRARSLAESASSAVADKSGIRILHVSDLHNRVSGALWVRALAHATEADVFAFTGDLSGLGSWAERLFLRLMHDRTRPLVYCQGNHDTDHLGHLVGKSHGIDLTGSVARAAGLSWWGYGDPNRTRLFIGPKYRPSLCVGSSKSVRLPTVPVVVAVHNDLMCPSMDAGARLVLSGHYHRPHYALKDDCHFVRCGSSGGGGPFGGDMHACVIDVDPVGHAPCGIWALSSADGGKCEVWLDPNL